MVENGDQLDCKGRSRQLSWENPFLKNIQSDRQQGYLAVLHHSSEKQGEPFGGCWNSLEECGSKPGQPLKDWRKARGSREPDPTDSHSVVGNLSLPYSLGPEILGKPGPSVKEGHVHIRPLLLTCQAGLAFPHSLFPLLRAGHLTAPCPTLTHSSLSLPLSLLPQPFPSRLSPCLGKCVKSTTSCFLQPSAKLLSVPFACALWRRITMWLQMLWPHLHASCNSVLSEFLSLGPTLGEKWGENHTGCSPGGFRQGCTSLLLVQRFPDWAPPRIIKEL